MTVDILYSRINVLDYKNVYLSLGLSEWTRAWSRAHFMMTRGMSLLLRKCRNVILTSLRTSLPNSRKATRPYIFAGRARWDFRSIWETILPIGIHRSGTFGQSTWSQAGGDDSQHNSSVWNISKSRRERFRSSSTLTLMMEVKYVYKVPIYQVFYKVTVFYE